MPLNLEAFERFLGEHDRFYYLTSSPGVYAMGASRAEALQRFLASDAVTPEHREIYDRHVLATTPDKIQSHECKHPVLS